MAIFSKDKLLAPAQGHETAMLAFLQDLVRIPSVNRRETEKAVAERILAEGKHLGFKSQLVAADENRPNAMVTFGEGKAGFALIGHLDTVAEGDPTKWKHPPFNAVIDGDKVYGRGTADNKAGIVCGMYALVLLRELGLLNPLTDRAILAGVVDEESGACSKLGVRHLLDEALLTVQGAIYTYASEIVCIGHRGLLRLEATAHGQAVHAGLLEWHLHKTGCNAATGLADMLVRLEKMKVGTLAVEGFEKLGCTVTPGTLVSGGIYESIVPDEAHAIIDIRLMPRQDVPMLLEMIGEIARNVMDDRPGLKIKFETKVNIPGASITPEHPLASIAQDYTEILTGRRWKAEGAGPANEGYMLINAGIPTLCGFGPEGGNPHALDEWVSLSSLPRTSAMYAGIMCEYLNLFKKGE